MRCFPAFPVLSVASLRTVLAALVGRPRLVERILGQQGPHTESGAERVYYLPNPALTGRLLRGKSFQKKSTKMNKADAGSKKTCTRIVWPCHIDEDETCVFPKNDQKQFRRVPRTPHMIIPTAKTSASKSNLT